MSESNARSTSSLPSLFSRRKPNRRSDALRIRHRRTQAENLEPRMLLATGPQLISVQPNSGDVLSNGVVRHLAPNELTFVFDESQVIDSSTLEGIRVMRAGFDDSFEGVTDVVVTPGFVGVDPDRPNQVIMRFAERLPDDLYRIQVFAVDDPARGLSALRNVEGDPFQPKSIGADRTTINFELDLGAQVVSVVPQPITRSADGSLSQARDQIQVYFNPDTLSVESATDVRFYNLIFTNETVENTDDEVIHPESVDYDPAANRATLHFASDLESLATGEGTYRLRIGTDEPLPAAPGSRAVDSDPGSSFETAMQLGAIESALLLSEEVVAPNFPLQYPGAIEEPGHRDIAEVQSHFFPFAQDWTAQVAGVEGQANPDLIGEDNVPGVFTIPYNFKNLYGWDPNGIPLNNLITEEQKDLSRSIFELYGHYLGVDFVETAEEGYTVATGDPRVVDPASTPGPGGVLGVTGDAWGSNPDPDADPDVVWPSSVMDAQELWDTTFGDTTDPARLSWFLTAMHEIGHLLGLGHTDELPAMTVMNGNVSGPAQAFFNVPEPTFPGPHDVVHGRFLYRPESNDIDLYQFDVETAGDFTAEVIAERRDNSSSLDSLLTLYRETPEGDREIVARNDDYRSEDSFVGLSLEAGSYYLAVTSTGNDAFDPTIENTGAGGTSQGGYDLRLDFNPLVDNFLVDATGTAFDGDADGVPGGEYSMWFQVADPSRTLYVDKAAPAGGDGSIAQPFNNLGVAMTAASAAFSNAESGIVRVVGNGGVDDDITTLRDNLAYELGTSEGRVLSDGATLTLPQGVTMMVDAGAVFKMLKSNIQVGSTSVTIDRSGSALQVLGTPDNQVVFTSYDDQTRGVDTNPRQTTPDPGDWGGLVFRNETDRAEGRFDYEQAGIFMNIVNQADIRYGGGNVTVNSIQQVVNPIHMIDARPTVSYNLIEFSADAAMSANPDSFEETNFVATDSLGVNYQSVPFTSDYQRIGPDIRGNRVTNNSTNGLFVRIATPAGRDLELMTVTGRWDDSDIVHVVPENLVIQSTPGGGFRDAGGNVSPRLDAQLRVDPKVVVKLDGSRIETQVGAQILAEGAEGRQIIFTSLLDDRYGAGGTFQTSGPSELDAPQPGDWSGIYVAPTAAASIDHAVIAFGGGVSRVEGTFAQFNAIEVHQADLRLTNSLLEHHADGRGGPAEPNRFGRLPNQPGAIFGRYSQPIIVNNVIKGTRGEIGPAITLDVHSLNQQITTDYGRSTGPIDAFSEFIDNEGALVRLNRLANNSINGMEVRGATLLSESVWDDTDIVHVLFDEIVVPNVHTFGGLRLESSPSESLVVKLKGQNAGFRASGTVLDIDDRIGGMVQILGQPGHPVVLTSFADDSVGAGFDPLGRPQTDTDGFRREVVDVLPGTFEIEINYGPIIRERPQYVEAIELATRFWERQLQDPVDLVFDVEIDPALRGSGTLGAATPAQITVPWDQVRQAMIDDGRAHEVEFLESMPTFAEASFILPEDSINPFSVNGNVTLTRANALALGMDPASLPGSPSQYDASETADGSIVFAPNPWDVTGEGWSSFFDLDRLDGLTPGFIDLMGVALHEIGHALGFISSVDDVDAAVNDPNGLRDISLTTFDMFRLEPGEGQLAGFTDASRVLDPVLDHVFYDGGHFDPFGITQVAELREGDIPLSTGEENGDGGQASHWKDLPVTIGLMDPTVSAYEGILTNADLTAYDLMGWDIDASGVPGDWRGIILEQWSHDRNMSVVTELEDPNLPAPGDNAVPDLAQNLGALGQAESESDENLRLGFVVHGTLDEPNDRDVYSFEARAGTEVWFDIDRTSPGLDSVVELINADGTVLARSDNSHAEAEGDEERFSLPGIFTADLQKSLTYDQDYYTQNVHDAGMRLILPGPAGNVTTYHLRVRSSSDDLDDVTAGLTTGTYEMQVRLREVDEFAGSTVQHADIRYAMDGIRVRGLPQHSLLNGEVTEAVWENAFGTPEDRNDELPVGRAVDPDQNGVSRDTNSRALMRITVAPGEIADDAPLAAQSDRFLEPQHLGNILQSDRAAISISGSINEFGDNVDWYLFDVAFDSIQNPGGNSAEFVFDLDYADGLSRLDGTIAIYEVNTVNSYTGGELQAGALTYYGRLGGGPDDGPAPLQGADLDDLSRGSVGPADPYIGPVSLTEGQYLLQVINPMVKQVELLQYTQELPPNPYIRMEPIDAVNRIAEDRIAEPITDEGQGTTFEPPQVPFLLHPNNAAVPLTLGDVELFVSSAAGVFSVDPFVGGVEVNYGAPMGMDETAGIAPLVRDIAFRDNPLFDPTSEDLNESRTQRLMAFANDLGTGANPSDATVGNYIWLDPNEETELERATSGLPAASIAAKGVGDDGALTDDGVVTYGPDPDSDDPAAPEPIELDEGMIYEAITINPNSPDYSEGFAVGQRPSVGVSNILVRFDAVTGEVLSATGEPQPEEERLPVPNPPGTPPQTLPMRQPNAGLDIVEQGVLDTTANTGPSATAAVDPATDTFTAAGHGLPLHSNVIVSGATIPDGLDETLDYWLVNVTEDTFQLAEEINGAPIDITEAAEELDVQTVAPGGTITGITLLGARMYGVTNRGGLYLIQGYAGQGARARYVRTIFEPSDDPTEAPSPVRFSGISAGPSEVERGAYRSTLFGIDSGGALFAFDGDGVSQPIFVDGKTFIETGARGANGVAFGGVQRNLWHVSPQRGADVGHGGGPSFYFGEDTNPGGGAPRNYDFLGGARGSIVTEPMSLEGYNVQHDPFLYFNYFLSTERSFDDPLNPTPRDTFRVFVTDEAREEERGQWHLLASNQPSELGTALDFNPDDDILLDVQPLWDSTWQDVPFLDTDDNTLIPNGVRDPFPYPDEDDERPFDPGDREWGTFGDNPVLNETAGVWRQARISLADFVGSDSIRLRFDFSTAGSFDIGGTGGVELRAVAGSEIADGDIVVIDDINFELDRGYTLLTAGGAVLADGETFTVETADAAITFEMDSDGNANVANTIVAFNEDDSAVAIGDAVEQAITDAGLAVAIFRNGNRMNLAGATAVSVDGSGGLALEGALGVADGNVAVSIDAGMTASDVAEAMVQPLADTFANGLVDVIKFHENIIKIYEQSVGDSGPFGLTEILPGDAMGNFNSPLRGKNTPENGGRNDERLFTFDDEDFNFTVPFEGVYVDDLIVGFASFGETSTDLRPDYTHEPVEDFENIPWVFEDQFGAVVNEPTEPGAIPTGEYQLEVRRASNYAAGDTPIRTFNVRDRLSESVTLLIPSGGELYDGQSFFISDGVNTVSFEFDDTALGNGVAEGAVAIPFSAGESAPVVMMRVRDAVNNQFIAGTLDVTAAGSNGEALGPIGTSNRLNLFSDVVTAGGDIQMIVFNESGQRNSRREQGQIVIDSNSITHSGLYGVVVEDAARDYPAFPLDGSLLPEDHSQANLADYNPSLGAPRHLREINQDDLMPGVVIQNNVIAFGSEGGVHFSGDAGGHSVIAPVAGTPGSAEIWDDGNLHYIVVITDNNGYSEWFEFGQAGHPFLPFIDTPIIWAPTDDCPDVHGIAQCSPRFEADDPDMTEAILLALGESNLDVKPYRTRSDEIYMEGAAQIQSVIVEGQPDSVSFSGENWFEPFNVVAPASTVPFGRIVNNTIVGNGGLLPGNNVYDDEDFSDTGILVEDNAAPTVLNNIVVNFKDGIGVDQTALGTVLSSSSEVQTPWPGVRVDQSAAGTVLGANLYQGNVKNTSNIDIDSFGIELGPNAPLFVDRDNGNFYLADGARAIDSSVDSVEDREEFSDVKEPLSISLSPILAPDYDRLGQLRIDDPRVETPEGFGQDVFKDRGAIDRVDFLGPIAQFEVPFDNDVGGTDLNPARDQVRVTDAQLNRFVVQLVDVGEATAPTGTGIDDTTVTADSVILRRDGEVLTPGVDYRFDYQGTTNQVVLTPQAGLWLTGFTYEIEIINRDRFIIETGPTVADGQQLQITSGDGSVVNLEIETGVSLQVPQTLTLSVPAGTSGLSAVSDAEIFTISNGVRLVTFEFDSNDDVETGRVPVRFQPSSTPAEVADAIVAAIDSAGLGLNPLNLGNGMVHVGGPFNTIVDTAVTALEQFGQPGVFVDGQTMIFGSGEDAVRFEFDSDEVVTGDNVPIPFDDNWTRQQLALTVVDTLNSSDLGLDVVLGPNGLVNLGSVAGLNITLETANLTLAGQTGLSNPGAVPVAFRPTEDIGSQEIASLMQQAIQADARLDSVDTLIDEFDRLVVIAAESVTGDFAMTEIGAVRDIAGNLLRTNQDETPFPTSLVVDLPAPLDFGDAPAPYPTSLTDNGARHVVVPNIQLGSTNSAELDGTSSDDSDDGVVFTTVVARGGSIPVLVAASTTGFVDAWVDMDGDGSFDDRDYVLQSVAVNRGPNTLRLEIPSDAMVGDTQARFRYSTLGGLAPTGRAADGEVEDYAVSIVDVPRPVAVGDTYEVAEDEVLTVDAADGLLTNDDSVTGDPLQVALVDPPEHGQVMVDPSGGFVYTPEANFFGTDVFTYRASTNILSSDVTTVQLDVTSVVDAPEAVDDFVTGVEDTPVTIDLVANDIDPDGALVRSSVEIVTEPENGQVTVDDQGVATYVPDPNYFGIDTFQYTVRDLEGAVSETATVTVELEGRNDPPIANNDSIFVPQQTPVRFDLLANDVDIDGTLARQTLSITQSPKSGNVQFNSDGTITFTPDAFFLGIDTFRYNVRDNGGLTSNEGVVTVTVSNENVAPVAADDQASTSVGQAVTINVIANDSDADGSIVPGSVSLVVMPQNGTAEPQLDGNVVYTPDAGFTGTDQFTYTVRDEFNDASNVATVTVQVIPETPPWQNPTNAFDVNNDGFVIPLDALLVINELNARGPRDLGPPPLDEEPFSPPPYLDVNGDDALSPIDALQVINQLNSETTNAVAAMTDRSTGSAFDAQIVGAALDIQPRRSADVQANVVEQLMVARSMADQRQAITWDDPARDVSERWEAWNELRQEAVDVDTTNELDDELLDVLASDARRDSRLLRNLG